MRTRKRATYGADLWVLVAAVLSLALLLAQPTSALASNEWIVIVLGAQIKTDLTTSAIVPAFHTLARTVAAAVYFRKIDPTQPFILSGGYNVGVRYDLNGTVYSRANFTFSAFAEARWNGPSEASVMAGVMSSPPYSVPMQFIALEDTSATTEENAKMTAIILGRSYFNGTRGVAVCSNLYHLASALPLFRAHIPADIAVQGLFAEDWVALDGSQDWISSITAYYSKPVGGRLWDAQRIGNIMQARKSGDLSISVAQLLS